MVKTTLTADRLREVLDYDPMIGVFRWHPRPRVAVSVPPGWISTNGYWRITIDHVPHYAHRLAWLHVYGSWPDVEIDHCNGDKLDNRIANLREANRVQNSQNIHIPQSNNRSGYLGVTAVDGRWRACIQVDKKKRSLGRFDTPQEAAAAYLIAKAERHPFWHRETVA